jgi:hypothetical protein
MAIKEKEDEKVKKDEDLVGQIQLKTLEKKKPNQRKNNNNRNTNRPIAQKNREQNPQNSQTPALHNAGDPQQPNQHKPKKKKPFRKPPPKS